MSTRSSARNLFPPLDNPELTIRRRSRAGPTLLNDFEMAAEGNGDPPVPDLRTVEELCQPSLNGRGGPIAPISIQATDFGFKNDMIQQSVDDQSLSDEDFPKEIYSNPLFDEEILSMKIDPHHFNDESDLIESLLNHDSSIISSSSKIDSLFDEFASEDIDSLMEEIDLSFMPDDPMPPGIEEDDYNPERDILILEELLDNYSLSLPENESFHFDIPSSSHPPAKPPDGNTGILNIKMMGDISEQKVPMPGLLITLVPNQEKSPDLLSHQGLEIFQPSAECSMMIHGKNTPILDVPLFHFYPP
nr:hypothetical protein [Tanacetum cinerariifolium]